MTGSPGHVRRTGSPRDRHCLLNDWCLRAPGMCLGNLPAWQGGRAPFYVGRDRFGDTRKLPGLRLESRGAGVLRSGSLHRSRRGSASGAQTGRRGSAPETPLFQ